MERGADLTGDGTYVDRMINVCLSDARLRKPEILTKGDASEESSARLSL